MCDRLKHGAVATLGASEGLHPRTLSHQWDKFVELREKGMGEEMALVEADREHRGGHNRALTTSEQAVLREDIVARHNAGEPVTDGDIGILGQQYWQQIHGKNIRSLPFGSSKGWVWAFKIRWALSSRSPRLLPPANPPHPVLDARYLADCKKWLDRVGPALFINLDETSVRLANASRTVVAPRGVRARVKAGADHRTCFTAIFAACANGHRLTPAIIKQCKTDRGLRPLVKAYGNKRVHFMKQSNGWSSAAGIVEFIETIIVPYTGGRQAALILDMFSGHTKKSVRNCLARHNIIPLWVPPNTTAARQPLDVAPFGVVKNKLRSYWHWRRSALLGGSTGVLTMQTIVGDALRAWHELGRDVVCRGFKQALELSSIPLSHPPHPVIVLERHPTTIYKCIGVGIRPRHKPYVRLYALRPGPILFIHKRFAPPPKHRSKPKKPRKATVKAAL